MNATRSVMAEAWLKHLHGQRIYVDSCGVYAGESNAFVTAVMGEVGLDVSHHKSKTFDDLVDGYFDLIVALSPQAHEHALELASMTAMEVEYWPTDDATAVSGSREQRLQAYRVVRDSLRDRIQQEFPVSI